jgi:hypothetical protein
MEQIQQHEWEKHSGKRYLYECKYCLITKHSGFNHGLYFINGNWKQKEPACITRPINAPQREADK